MILHLDFESRSKCDLRKSGAWRYSIDPSTEILCFAYAYNDGPIQIMTRKDILMESERFLEFKKTVPTLEEVHAHNANFEMCIWENILVRRFGFLPIPIAKWRCSAARCAALSLPRKLEKVAQVLGMTIQKDMDGHRLMLKMSKPRKPTKHDSSIWHEKPEDFERLYTYCINDVAVERALDHYLPKLVPHEQTVWHYDQVINRRGVQIDYELVTNAIKMFTQYEYDLTNRAKEASNFILPGVGSRDKLIEWLRMFEGVDMENAQKATVERLLSSPESNLSANAREILEIRQQLSKSSVKKYQAMEAAVDKSTMRIMGTMIYHGAGTGRWCLPGEAEVLTRNGWVKLNNFLSGEILQWEENGVLSFSEAKNNIFQKQTDEELIFISNKHIMTPVTKEHTFPMIRNKSKKVSTQKAESLIAEDSFILSGNYCQDFKDEIQTRFWVMLQADGCLCLDTSRGRMIKFGFKRLRKIERCKMILQKANIPFSCMTEKKSGATRIKIRWVDAPDWAKEKRFSSNLLKHNPKVFIDELQYWDSFSDKRNHYSSFEFNTTNKSDAEWAATMAHLAAYSATVGVKKLKPLNWADCYRVRISPRKTVTFKKSQRKNILYKGEVFCPTTKTGFFLCRYKNHIFVSGNSGRIIQPQNFPRGTVKDIANAISLIKGQDYAALDMLYGDVAGVLSSTIRGALIPREGYEFMVADYAAIEARVLVWLAGDTVTCQKFKDGVDLYVDMAASFKSRHSLVTSGNESR